MQSMPLLEFLFNAGLISCLAGAAAGLAGIRAPRRARIIENIGIILIGFGAALLFRALGHPTLAAIALIAGLYHTMNHAIFKCLLFLGAGALLALTAALAAACFVKAFGISFLALPRSENAAQAH
jgi:NADH:ubiquinone oxidoreductase subunit 5 (subunit L)/multisubunit Na+/H+ antiporter MnhA subunit